MKIKKSSWHYRLVSWWCAGRVPDNMCRYLRGLAGGLLVFLITCAILALVLGGSLFFMYEEGIVETLKVVAVVAVLFFAMFAVPEAIKLVCKTIDFLDSHCRKIEYED